MADQELRGHSSENIRNLRKRLPKCWKWIDQVLSPKYAKENIKKDVVLALFGKALPSKIAGPDEGEGTPLFDHFQKLSGTDLDLAEAAILKRGVQVAGASRN